MKKIYVLVIACFLSVYCFGTTWYFNATVSSDMTNLSNWSTTSLVGSGTNPTGANLLLPLDNWIIDTWSAQITSGEVFSIAGSLYVTTGAHILKNGLNPASIRVGNSFNMTDSAHVTTSVAGDSLYMYSYGSFSVGDSSYFTSGTATDFIHIHFCDTTDVTGSYASAKNIIWSNAGAVNRSNRTSITIDKRSVRRVVGGNLPLPTSPNVNDSLRGTLWLTTNAVVGTASTTFCIADSATVLTAIAGGLDSSIKMNATGDAYWYSQQANYVFNGSAAQITGVTFPDTVNNSTSGAVQGMVTINNTAGVTLSNAVYFENYSMLNLESGTLSNGTKLTMSNATTVSVDAGTVAAAPTYISGVTVVYNNLGPDLLSVTTGNELEPVNDTGLQQVLIKKPFATITLGSPITVEGKVAIDTGTLDASTSNYTIAINPNAGWPVGELDNFAGPGAFVPRGDTVIFNTTPLASYSVVAGSYPVVFTNLTVNTRQPLLLINSDTVNKLLTLASGNIFLYHPAASTPDTLYFGASALPVAMGPTGVFSDTNMIVSPAGFGEVRKFFNADGSYMFPIGDSAHYVPITVTFNGTGSYAPGSYAGVTTTHHKHPANANIGNYLKRYWSLDLSGMTSPRYSVSVQYVPGDVNGNNSKLDMGQYVGGSVPWVRGLLGDPFTDTLATGLMATVMTGVPPNDYTGIDSTNPTVALSLADTILCVPDPGFSLSALSGHGDPTLSYTWAPSAGLSATTGLTVTVNPTVTTTYTVTITDGNGFTGTAKTSVTVNAAPTMGSIAGNGPNLCVGDTLALAATDTAHVASFAWAGPVTISKGLDSNAAEVYTVTTAASGVYTLTVTNGPGVNCALDSFYTLAVHALPLAPTVGTAGVYCDTNTIVALGGTGTIYYEGITDSGTTTTYKESSFTVDSSGTYYFRTHDDTYGCWGGQGKVTVTINPLPALDTFTALLNSGIFCANDTGLHVKLNTSVLGIKYQLDSADVAVGMAIMGTGDTIDFGLKRDSVWYTVTATNVATTCSVVMPDSVFINRIPVPTIQTVTGGGGYCVGGTGVAIGLLYYSDSDTYYLVHSGSVIDSVYFPFGSTAPYNFVASYDSPGLYYVKAVDNINGCIDTMTTYDSVWVNPLPNVHKVFGGGTICAMAAGVNVELSSDDTSTAYQLMLNWMPVGIPITPARPYSDTFNFGAQTGNGTYNVIATTIYGCVDTMLDSAVVNVKPLPNTYPVLESSIHDYCVYDTTAVTISLGGSDPGISYQLYYNGASRGTAMAGTGTFLIFGSFTDTGTYKIIATDTSSLCDNTMLDSATIHIHYRPNVYSVFGEGTICSGSTGVDVRLSGQDSGVTYTLIYGGTSSVSTVTSTTTVTSDTLDFGTQTGMGTYTAIATSAVYACTVNMLDSANVHVNSLPTVYNVTGGGAHCFPGISFAVGLSGSDTGVSYKLYLDSTTTVATHFSTTASGSFNYSTYSTAGNYTVIATRISTGCKDTMDGNAVITIYPLPLPYNVSGSDTFCAGAIGSQVLLSNSQTGVSYNLYRDTFSTVVATQPGSGSGLNFGYQGLGGKYTVIATNTTTGCVNNMDTFALLVSHPLPAAYTLAGGGSYCIGGSGLPIYLDASNVGIRYTLYYGGVPVGVVYGTGFGIGYGTFATAGAYTGIAVDTATGCTSPLANTINISINSLPAVFNVSGGGSGCTGSGFHVKLSGSVSTVRYWIYNGGVLVDSLTGTGDSLLFGPFTTAGTYTVIAEDLFTLCSINMTGSAIINEIPAPRIDTITGGGSYCAGGIGPLIGLDSSKVGINYQAVLGGLNIGGPQVGTGHAIEFGHFLLPGEYRIWALDTFNLCIDTMAESKLITINLLPNQFTVDGGGPYCTLDTGLHVGLSGSDTGISYQLYTAAGLIGSPWAGDGYALDFGLETAATVYEVAAVNNTTGCRDTMSGAATVTIVPIQVPVVKLTAYPDTLVPVGTADTIVATITSGGGINPTFQWLINNNVIYGATSDTLDFNVYFDRDSLVCQVTSEGPCGGITTNQLIVIHLYVDAVPVVKAPGIDVRLVPNPNNGTFTLKGTLGNGINEDATAEVTDMLGQVVYSSKMAVKNGMVNEHIQLPGSLANGMYLLNLRSGSASSVIHFVVEQ